MRQLLLAAGLLLPVCPLTAQDVASPRPEDVATIDGIISAVYASISGPAAKGGD